MLNPSFTSLFKKDRKLMQKRNRDMDKLTDMIALFINEQPLLPKHDNHPLHGKYQGKWECHVEPDWLLIYRIDKDNRHIIFYRTGTHSDLF
jgi:mRNA interferase YafQ